MFLPDTIGPSHNNNWVELLLLWDSSSGHTSLAVAPCAVEGLNGGYFSQKEPGIIPAMSSEMPGPYDYTAEGISPRGQEVRYWKDVSIVETSQMQTSTRHKRYHSYHEFEDEMLQSGYAKFSKNGEVYWRQVDDAMMDSPDACQAPVSIFEPSNSVSVVEPLTQHTPSGGDERKIFTLRHDHESAEIVPLVDSGSHANRQLFQGKGYRLVDPLEPHIKTKNAAERVSHKVPYSHNLEIKKCNANNLAARDRTVSNPNEWNLLVQETALAGDDVSGAPHQKLDHDHYANECFPSSSNRLEGKHPTLRL